MTIDNNTLYYIIQSTKVYNIRDFVIGITKGSNIEGYGKMRDMVCEVYFDRVLFCDTEYGILYDTYFKTKDESENYWAVHEKNISIVQEPEREAIKDIFNKYIEFLE